MQEINKHNSEEWFFNYAEGNLTAQEMKAVEAFVANHPELKSDFDSWMQSKVVMQPVEFPDVDSLLGKKKKRFGIWFWYLNGALALTLVAGVFYWKGNATRNEKNETIVVKNQPFQQEPESVKTTDHPIDAAPETVVLANTIPDKTEQQNNNAVSSEVQSSTPALKQKIKKNKNNSPVASLAGSTNQENCCRPGKFNPDDKEVPLQSPNEVVSNSEPDNPSVGALKEAETISNTENPGAVSESSNSITIECNNVGCIEDSINNNLPKEKNDLEKKRYLMLHGFSGVSFRVLPPVLPGSIVDGIIRERNEREIPTMCFSVGLEYGKPVFKKHYLRFGIQYAVLGEDTKTLEAEFASIDSFGVVTRKYDHYSFQYRYHFAELTIGATFNYLNKKAITCGVEVDIMPGWLVQYKTTILPHHQQGDTIVVNKSTTNNDYHANNPSLGFAVSLPVQLRLSSRFSILFAPYYRRQVLMSNGVYRNTPAGIEQYQYAYGLKVGLLYKF